LVRTTVLQIVDTEAKYASSNSSTEVFKSRNKDRAENGRPSLHCVSAILMSFHNLQFVSVELCLSGMTLYRV